MITGNRAITGKDEDEDESYGDLLVPRTEWEIEGENSAYGYG